MAEHLTTTRLQHVYTVDAVDTHLMILATHNQQFPIRGRVVDVTGRADIMIWVRTIPHQAGGH